MLYNKRVLDLFARPKNVGIIQNASAIGNYTNKQTNDVYKLYLKIEDDKIIDASFKAFCGADGIAVFSVFTDILKNKQIDEITTISPAIITDKIGELNEGNLSISDAFETLNLALVDYKKKQLKLSKLKA